MRFDKHHIFFEPVAFAPGTGTQIIQNMAISIMGGLTFAIFVNLFAIPLIMDWWGKTISSGSP